MIKTIVGVILAVLAVLIVVLPVLFGLMRGLKKTTFRLVWVLVSGLLCFAFTGLISKGLLSINLSAFNINIGGEVITSLPDYFAKLLSQISPEVELIISNNPELTKLFVLLISLVLNLVLFLILFWGVKWLLWPLWEIIAAVSFKKYKVTKADKKYLPNGVVVPATETKTLINKRPWLGALVGLGLGLLTLFFTFVPIVGISNTIIAIEESTKTIQDDGTKKGVISANLGDYSSYITVYQDSVVGKVFKYTGLNAVAGGVSKLLTTGKFNGQKITLENEIRSLGSIYVDYETFNTALEQEPNKENIAAVLTSSKKLANNVLGSGVVKGVCVSLVPYFVDNLTTNPDFYVKLPDLQDDILNEELKNQLLLLKSYNINYLQQDAISIIEILEELNNIELLIPIINKTITAELVQEKLPLSTFETINDKLFSNNLVKNNLPSLADAGVEYACKMLDVEYVENENINRERVAENFKTALLNVATALETYNKDNVFYVDTTAFANVGTAVDSIISAELLSKETHNNLMGYVENKVGTIVDDINIDNEVKTLAKTLIADIKEIPNYSTELDNLGKAYKAYENRDEDVEIDFQMIFSLINNVKNCYLYSANIDEILNFATDYAVEYINKADLPIATENVSQIVNCIKDVQDFETEYQNAKNSIDFIYELIEVGNFEAEIKKDGTLTSLGKNLDQSILNGSVLLGDANCKLLIQSMLEKIELPDDIENVTIDGNSARNKIISNVQNIENYELELGCAEKALNLDVGEDLTNIGATLNELKNSQLFGNILKPLVKHYVEIEANKLTNADLKTIVLNIKNNVDLVEDFEAELSYLNDLQNIDFETETLISIGKKLDEFRLSKLINPSLNDIIILGINENTSQFTTESVQNIIEKIKANISKVNSYEIEFAHLEDFINLDVENASMSEFGALLDSLIPSALFEGTINDILKIGFDEGTSTIGADAKYTEILTDMKANINNITSENPLYNNTVYSAEISFVDKFVQFANNGEEKTANSIQQFLMANILDGNQNSRSIIFADNVLKDIVKLGVDKIEEDTDINELTQTFVEVKNQIDNSTASIIAILEELKLVGQKIENITSISETSTEDEIKNIGIEIDSLRMQEFADVMNDNAVDSIGKYAVEKYNEIVQNNSELSAQQKQNIQNFVDGLTYKNENYTTVFNIMVLHVRNYTV